MITLCGEADITTAATLSQVMTAQLAGGTRHLAIDAAGLSFADSAALHVLLMAAKTLRERGGSLLLRPQSPVARVLELTGACDLLTIRGEAGAAPRGPGHKPGRA